MDEPDDGVADRARCLTSLQRALGAPRYADAMITLAAYSHVFHGSADQLARVRRDVQDYLAGCLSRRWHGR